MASGRQKTPLGTQEHREHNFYSSIRKKIYTHEETRVSFFSIGDISFFVFLVFPIKKMAINGVITPFVLEHNWEHNGNTIFFVCSQTKNPLPLCVKKENGGNGRKNHVAYLRSSILMR